GPMKKLVFVVALAACGGAQKSSSGGGGISNTATGGGATQPSEPLTGGGGGGGNDRDGDGVTDDTDRCPDEPEEFAGFADEVGCPEQMVRPRRTALTVVVGRAHRGAGNARRTERW